jgi:hypothetical protein
MRFHKFISLGCIAVPLLLGQLPANGDGSWPRELDSDSIHLVIYQPPRTTFSRMPEGSRGGFSSRGGGHR